jgi:surfeit locus 1 family protein
VRSILRRPKWLVGTVICLLVVVLFANLGLWQLRRLDEKQERNALVETRMEQAPVDVLEADGALEYRRVTAEGTYDPSGQVIVRGRSLDEAPGRWVLTPLVLADGSAVLVNRGFVPNTVDVPAPPDGEQRVEGILRATEERGRYGPRDPAEGTLHELARADIGRIQQQYEPTLFPFYLQRLDDAAVGTELPVALPPPALDEGPHLGYAVQWFLFAAVGLIGWPILLRRAAIEQDDEGDDDDVVLAA